MKYLLILLFLFPAFVWAQKSTEIKKDSSQKFTQVIYCDTCVTAKIINDTLFIPIRRREVTSIDTVEVIMLMTDTSQYSGTTLNGNGIAFWQIGYEIRTGKYSCCNPNEKTNSSYYWTYTHVAYLNGDKKELPKNIFVWQSKQL